MYKSMLTKHASYFKRGAHVSPVSPPAYGPELQLKNCYSNSGPSSMVERHANSLLRWSLMCIMFSHPQLYGMCFYVLFFFSITKVFTRKLHWIFQNNYSKYNNSITHRNWLISGHPNFVSYCNHTLAIIIPLIYK